MKSLALALCILFAAPAMAYFQVDMLKGKKPAPEADVQWTLADWLSQKSKVKLMDQWLSAHRSPHWLEMSLGATGQQYQKKTTGTSLVTTDQTAMLYQADYYISLLNFYGEYQKTNDHKESAAGAAGLRLLGSSARTTALVGRYGLRTLTDQTTTERWQQTFAEGTLQLYVIRAFALSGEYRQYFPVTSSLGNGLQGHRVTAGVFFELSVFRLTAGYFQEPMEFTNNGVITRQTSDGYEAGLKLMF